MLEPDDLLIAAPEHLGHALLARPQRFVDLALAGHVGADPGELDGLACGADEEDARLDPALRPVGTRHAVDELELVAPTRHQRLEVDRVTRVDEIAELAR